MMQLQVMCCRSFGQLFFVTSRIFEGHRISWILQKLADFVLESRHQKSTAHSSRQLAIAWDVASEISQNDQKFTQKFQQKINMKSPK